MSKQTPIKGRPGQTPSVSQENVLASVRPSRGSLQGAATAKEVSGAHTTPAKGPILTHEQIAVRAYQLWEAHGRRTGTDRDDWFEAEQFLRAKAR